MNFSARKRTEAFCWITDWMTSDRRCFALLKCPWPSWDHLKHPSLSSVLYQLLLGFLAAVLPDVTGFEGSLRQFTCSHVVNMCHVETELDSSLWVQLGICKNIWYRGRAKHLLTFSQKQVFMLSSLWLYPPLFSPPIIWPSLWKNLTNILVKETIFPTTKIIQTGEFFSARFLRVVVID